MMQESENQTGVSRRKRSKTDVRRGSSGLAKVTDGDEPEKEASIGNQTRSRRAREGAIIGDEGEAADGVSAMRAFFCERDEKPEPQRTGEKRFPVKPE